jgi:hypothetical protein
MGSRLPTALIVNPVVKWMGSEQARAIRTKPVYDSVSLEPRPRNVAGSQKPLRPAAIIPITVFKKPAISGDVLCWRSLMLRAMATTARPE